jgi:hypothetical protein
MAALKTPAASVLAKNESLLSKSKYIESSSSRNTSRATLKYFVLYNTMPRATLLYYGMWYTSSSYFSLLQLDLAISSAGLARFHAHFNFLPAEVAA